MFRFSIRDMLWLTVVVAMGVGWWVDWDRNWRQNESSRQVVDRFNKIGVDTEQLLKNLEAPRPPPVRVFKIKSGGVPVPGRSDYQLPPRPPKRISDEERP